MSDVVQCDHCKKQAAAEDVFKDWGLYEPGTWMLCGECYEEGWRYCDACAKLFRGAHRCLPSTGGVSMMARRPSYLH